MSNQYPNLPHRYTRSAAGMSSSAASHNPQDPHHLDFQAHNTNTRPSMAYSPQPTTPPSTPNRSSQTAADASAITSGSVSKPKSKTKNRPKNVMTSPVPSRNERSKTPLAGVQSASILSAKPIATPSIAAYAGPTFHASPAPSALPIPSFYSKSVPDSPSIKAFNEPSDENSSTSSDSPTLLAAQNLAAQSQRDESPLDFFFRADRAEKERARSTNSHLGSRVPSGPFQPPRDSPPQGRITPLFAGERSIRPNYSAAGDTSAQFTLELDGTNSPGKPYGPAFSTPYNERINAALFSGSAVPSSSTTTPEQQRPQDPSEALKQVLFGMKSNTSSLPGNQSPKQVVGLKTLVSTPGNAFRNNSIGGPRDNSSPSRHQNNSSLVNGSSLPSNQPSTGARSSGLRQEMTPTKTPVMGPDQSHKSPQYLSQLSNSSPSNYGGNLYSHSQSGTPYRKSRLESESGSDAVDLRGMEDEIRRILKIEPSNRSGF